MLDHSLDDSESGPTVASVPARDWSGGKSELRDLQESSSCWACTTHESTQSSPLFAPNAPNTLQFPCFTFFCFFDSRLLTTHIRAKGACDVHNRGEALFCLPLRPRDSCILGLCNSHSEHRGRVTATKRMPDLYLWTTAMCLAMRRPRIAEGGWKTSTAL
jgi:hypothetical protein